jgi:hypothetical protein
LLLLRPRDALLLEARLDLLLTLRREVRSPALLLPRRWEVRSPALLPGSRVPLSPYRASRSLEHLPLPHRLLGRRQLRRRKRKKEEGDWIRISPENAHQRFKEEPQKEEDQERQQQQQQLQRQRVFIIFQLLFFRFVTRTCQPEEGKKIPLSFSHLFVNVNRFYSGPRS